MLTLSWAHGAGAQTKPSGELVWALHVSISPSWFDPGENGGLITPFAVLYAMHDGVVRPMPGQKIGNSLAESWTESPDGLVYEFKLRQGLRFHNGDPCTAEDVQFSFDRYKGGGATELRANVQRVEVVDPLTVRFHLQEPWPDFLTFYGTSATAAGLVVPKKYLEQVGDDGFKKHPIGLGAIPQKSPCACRLVVLTTADAVDRIALGSVSGNGSASGTAGDAPQNAAAPVPSPPDGV